MSAGSTASTGESERRGASKASCARCLRRSIWEATIPTKCKPPSSVRLSTAERRVGHGGGKRKPRPQKSVFGSKSVVKKSKQTSERKLPSSICSTTPKAAPSATKTQDSRIQKQSVRSGAGPRTAHAPRLPEAHAPASVCMYTLLASQLAPGGAPHPAQPSPSELCSSRGHAQVGGVGAGRGRGAGMPL